MLVARTECGESEEVEGRASSAEGMREKIESKKFSLVGFLKFRKAVRPLSSVWELDLL